MLQHISRELSLYAARLYPSGDFTAGRISNPPQIRDKDTHPLEGIREDSYWHEGKENKFYEYDDRQLLAAPPMGLSDATNSHRLRGKQGQNGITGLGKRKLRSAAVVLARSCPRDLTSFLTCTLPNLPEDDLIKICENWAELIRQFKQELIRMLDRKGIKSEYFYCTEIQEKRYVNTGVLAPHLHIVFQGKLKRSDPWAVSKDEARDLWQRLLEKFLGYPVDSKAATRIEKPRGSIAKEIAKYISKGGKILKQIKQDGKAHLLPSSWWGMARNLSRAVDLAVIKLTGDCASWFVDALRDLPGIVYRTICLEAYGGICIGWAGYIKDLKLLQQFQNLNL